MIPLSSAPSRHLLDARGLVCPLPVLKARKILLQLPPGDMLDVLVTDAQAARDFPLFCAEQGHAFVGISDGDGGGMSVTTITVMRGPQSEKENAA